MRGIPLTMETFEKRPSLFMLLGIVVLSFTLEHAGSAKITKPNPDDDKATQLLELFNHPYDYDDVDDIISHMSGDVPDISEIENGLDRRASFSVFNPYHRKLAGKLIDIFMRAPNVDKLLGYAATARNKVNPQLFNYALSITVVHRADLSSRSLAPLASVMPEKFIERLTLHKVREFRANGTTAPGCIERTPTSTSEYDEHRLSYYSEDIGVNLHHWYWHLIYPFEIERSRHKERRGELFSSMHQQMLARYHFERLSNGLKRVVPFSNFSEKIPQAYFSKLDNTPYEPFADRPANCTIADFFYPNSDREVKIKRVELNVQRLKESIASKTILYANGSIVKPADEDYIDILVNAAESSTLSPNPDYYGDLHNEIHVAISTCHDPRGIHLTNAGVMSGTETAVRDPAFYRWHTFMDNLFNEHKITLPPYDSKQLRFDGVTITSVKVKTDHGSAKENEFLTFMERSGLDIKNGTRSYDNTNPPLVCFDHLQHHAFTYNIKVKSQKEVYGTVRIFLAPIHDENGKAYDFNTQRRFFIELDRFVHKLKAGENEIKRTSGESSVTAPVNGTFQGLRFVPASASTTNFISDMPKEYYNGCGWPEYFLIPKGTEKGLPSKLFVIISDYENGDKVEGVSPSDVANLSGNIMCGTWDKRYPYKRPMGFPFDRIQKENSFTKFSAHPNMATIDAQVRFIGKK